MRRTDPNYIPPWQRIHEGRVWQDMPGHGNDTKKLNFALFRHGKITIEDAETDAQIDADLDQENPDDAPEEEVTPPPVKKKTKIGRLGWAERMSHQKGIRAARRGAFLTRTMSID